MHPRLVRGAHSNGKEPRRVLHTKNGKREENGCTQNLCPLVPRAIKFVGRIRV